MIEYSVYNSEFKVDVREIKLRELAKQYHDECDAYDDRVCKARNEYGESVPQSNGQYQMINQNAIHVRRKIEMIAKRQGFSRDEIFKAIKDHHKYNK
jgi:HD superfamily phosphohydrolase YqeK